jgi:hypothetical protein
MTVGSLGTDNPKQVFTNIFRKNWWNNGESRSGRGTELKRTVSIRAELPGFVRRHGTGHRRMAAIRYRMTLRPFHMLPETETMNRIASALIMLCAAGTCSAQEIRSSDARPSMPYVGTAAMLDDGTISLHLRLTTDGKSINDTLVYKVSDHAYDNVLRHLGGLRPGETKEFRPWKD